MHIRCFDAAKDVNIPTPNIHFPRTPYASPLPAVTSTARPLLLFYAGWNYDTRARTLARARARARARTRTLTLTRTRIRTLARALALALTLALTSDSTYREAWMPTSHFLDMSVLAAAS